MILVENRIIDLQKAKEHFKYRIKDMTQQELITSILEHDYLSYGNNEQWGNQITWQQIGELGVKKPQVLINQLIKKGVLKKTEISSNLSLYGLKDKQVICKNCYMQFEEYNYFGNDNRRYEKVGRITKVFVWEREDHLQKFHKWDPKMPYYEKWEEEFTEKTPGKRHDHKFKFVSLEGNYATFQCELCNDTIHETLDNRNNSCEYGVFE